MNEEIKLKIIDQWLSDIPFEGINTSSLEQSALNAGYNKDTVSAIFPYKIQNALQYLSEHFDNQMLKTLNDLDTEHLSIRDKIKTAAMIRIKMMNEHKEAYKTITAYWVNPVRTIKAKKIIWNTADKIWNWAGDTSTDYNHYTKRGILSAVLGATYAYWVAKEDKTLEKTESFLYRGLEKSVKFGTMVGKVIKKHPA